MATLFTMSHHRSKDLRSQSFPSPIKRVRAKRTLTLSESDPNFSDEEEMEWQPNHPSSPGYCVIRPTKLVFDSPEKSEPESWHGGVTKPSINVIPCEEEHSKNGYMTPPPPQSNSTPLTKSHSAYKHRIRASSGDVPSTPKSFKYSHLTNNSHLHCSRDPAKILISNIFSPEGMCLESAKKLYNIKRQRQLLRSFESVETKSPTTTSRILEDESTEDHHPVFDVKSVSSSSIDHSRYVLEFHEEELLGSGDFGVVHKCLKFIDGMTYAVKRSRDIVTNTAKEKVFRKEIHASALLARAPHIVNYFSSWSDQGVYYLQLEYCNGGTLKNIIEKECSFSDTALRQLLFHVCEALRYMHAMRMIHMDIKPANILIVKPHAMLDQPVITEQLNYKIGDFGHVIADDEFEVEEGDCIYMPKELLNYNYDNLSKVDIFSLGLTLYETSGVTPLPKNGPMWHHIRDKSISKQSNMSDDLYSLIKLMIDKDPSKRPSAAEILKIRTSPSCDCICCTCDTSHKRNFDFKSDYIQKYADQRTIVMPSILHS